MKKSYLINWKIEGKLASLTYSDGEKFKVKKSDFNRAFGTMLNSPKEDVKKDFAVV